jgi:hypothetical protein
MFIFIGLAIFGGLVKKFKSNDKHDKQYYKFMIGAFVSVIFIALTFGYQTVECVYNLTVDAINYSHNAYGECENNNEYFIQIVIPQIIKMVTFIGFNAVLFVPSLLKHSKAK